MRLPTLRVFHPGLLAVSAVLLTAGACSSPEPEAARDINVILISVDTLRADHLGCYGYPRPTSPVIDELCGDSVVFRQAIAQAPSTLHSHASMLSSLLPHHHQASWQKRTGLPEEAVTLAEVLGDAGLRTVAFTGGGQMDRIFGLAQGFDLYKQLPPKYFGATVRRALKWIRRSRPAPFFMFLHTYEVHHPYTPRVAHLEVFEKDYSGPLPGHISVELLKQINRGEVEIGDEDLQHIVNTYDAEIRSMDGGLDQLVVFLKKKGIYDRTMIVLTSDHGEEFGEHGVVGWHSHSLYDELLRVPLIIKYPNSRFAGTEVSRQVRSIDIAPTILAALGIEIPEEFQGVDLAEWLDTRGGRELAAVSRIDAADTRDFDSLRTEKWKLDRRSLYDLSADPGEMQNRRADRLQTVEELEELLAEQVARHPRLAPQKVAVPKETLQDLKALGYIQ